MARPPVTLPVLSDSPGEAQIDASRCPLCGGDNRCGMATGTSEGKDCWCFSVTVPAELLSRVPEPLRDRACICAACIAACTDDH